MHPGCRPHSAHLGSAKRSWRGKSYENWVDQGGAWLFPPATVKGPANLINDAINKPERAGNQQRALIGGALAAVCLDEIAIDHDDFFSGNEKGAGVDRLCQPQPGQTQHDQTQQDQVQ